MGGAWGGQGECGVSGGGRGSGGACATASEGVVGLERQEGGGEAVAGEACAIVAMPIGDANGVGVEVGNVHGTALRVWWVDRPNEATKIPYLIQALTYAQCTSICDALAQTRIAFAKRARRPTPARRRRQGAERQPL